MKKLNKGYTFRNSKTNTVAPIDRVPSNVPLNKIDDTRSPFRIVFAIIMVLIIVVSLLRLTGGIGSGNALTFTGFLDYLSTLDFNSVDFNILKLTLDGGWGAFDFIRVFINFTLSFWNFCVTICQVLINVAVFVFNIGKWIFVA